MTHSFSLRAHVIALWFALTVLFLGSAQLASAQVMNGSFEAGDDPGSYSTIIPGDTDITGWTVTVGSVDYIGTYWQAAEGARSIDLNGTEAGAISQTIPTVIGAKYDVTFYISGNPDGGPSLKELAVGATGVAPQNYSYDTAAEGNTKADMKWSSRTYSFLATGVSTTLTFESLIDGAFGPALDNISIVETLPPPPPCNNCGCGGSSSNANGNVNGINVSVSQSGCINNNTSANASTGGNTAGGSKGGRGGRGGSIRANGGGFGSPSIGNNGGATAGNGGAGGAGAEGGFIQSGNANANASTTNILNRIRIRIGL